MSLENIANLERFTGNASTVTAYVLPFAYADSADLIVTRITEDNERTTLELGTDFNITGQDLTTAVAIPVDEFLEVERSTALVQELAPTAPASSYIASVAAVLDQIMMAVQDLFGRVGRYFNRSVRVPAGETLDQLPAVADRLGMIPYFNASTGALELKTPAQLIALADSPFTVEIGDVDHLEAGQEPTATMSGTWPTFILSLGLPTGATGSIEGGPDCGFGTLPNEDGGQDFAVIDNLDGVTLHRIRIENGVPVVVAPV